MSPSPFENSPPMPWPSAVDGSIAVLSADIRHGRPFDRCRRFGLAVADWLHEGWGIPRPNLKTSSPNTTGAI